MWWRWLLVLPGFLVGMVGIPFLFFLGYMVTAFLEGDLDLNSDPPYWAKITQDITSGYFSVYVGAIAAPTRQVMVAVALTVLTIAILAFGALNPNRWGIEFVVRSVIGLVAASVAVYMIYGKNRTTS